MADETPKFDGQQVGRLGGSSVIVAGKPFRLDRLDNLAAIHAAMGKVIRLAANGKLEVETANKFILMLSRAHKARYDMTTLELEQRKIDLLEGAGGLLPFMGFGVVPPKDRQPAMLDVTPTPPENLDEG